MNRTLIYSALSGLMLMSHAAMAVDFDGFMTAGFAAHNADDGNGGEVVYLNGITNDPSFDNDSKFGLQVTADVSEDMQGVAQILATGADQNYDLDVEWAYLDYTLNQNLSLRGGKVKEPVFLISDYIEVGYAYPWIRPPQEVYSNNPINTIVGMEALAVADLGGINLLIQPYLGSNTDDVPGYNGQAQFNAENFYGLAIQLSSRAFTFQVSYLKTDVATTGFAPFSYPAPGDTPTPISVVNVSAEGTATLASAGVSWDVSNFVGYAEYVSRNIEANKDITSPADLADGFGMDMLFPDQTAWYVTLGYRIGKFLPHVTVAHLESDPFVLKDAGDIVPSPLGVGDRQDSVTVGMRYELNDSAALKVELENIVVDNDPILGSDGGSGTTNYYSNGLFNDASGFPNGDIDKNSISMISVAIDVIF